LGTSRICLKSLRMTAENSRFLDFEGCPKLDIRFTMAKLRIGWSLLCLK